MLNKKEQNVDVAEIMREIKRNVGECEDCGNYNIDKVVNTSLAGDSAESIDVAEFLNALDYANDNCRTPYYWELGSRGIKRFIKRVIRKAVKFLGTTILSYQNAFNGSVVSCLNQLRYFVFSSQKEYAALEKEIEQKDLELKQLTDIVEGLKNQIQELAENNVKLQDNFLTQEESIYKLKNTESIESRFARQEDINHDLEARLYWREKDDETFRSQIELLSRDSDDFRSSVAKLMLKQRGEKPIEEIKKDERKEVSSEVGGSSVYSKLDYFKFQNHFRGTRMQIKKRQEIYLPYFKGTDETVLDIGCGRGEFLSLMKENDIPAFGVDMYPEYVVEGELNGLDIRCGDGIQFLRNSEICFGGIFCAQVIEHINFAELQELCFTAYTKLIEGGCLILETPNPTCLSIFSGAFYTDPTHNKPLPPWLVEYVLREAGFRDIEVIFTEGSRAGEPLPKIKGNGIENLDEVNAGISKVSELLYGSQDYAIVARK